MVIPSEHTQKAWAALFRAHTLAHEAIEAELKKARLPNLSWYDVLWELEQTSECGLRAFELQPKLLLPQYGMSRLINRMEAQGLIAKHDCPEDGRGVALSITDQGRKMRRKMWAVYGPAMQKALGEKLSENEMAQLATMLKKLT
ncbi:MarR family winged helix-turn-helix transcriptional regulator [uncultured Maritalea sp.]|uniref:MarR family winged helix-turn-helix transcriptional regulator n=1 Tax=uncultured Maritalea sp. TaxID=757249 RepID=UPI0026173AD0|nr:MarR family winged helix-turn-helix transcriptional regulator [uncultured Maritalea sp.]